MKEIPEKEGNYRIEEDFLGQCYVPEDAYWGIHTYRAVNNFPISGYRLPSVFIRSMAIVKKAACLANLELGYIERRKAEAIISACDEIISGRFDEEFPLDAFQGGAGTSTNMNLNEVIANRAIEILGGKKGDYSLVHPIEDVNLHQSTNDTYPTALKIASIFELRRLSERIASLQGAFQRKEKEFADIVKVGRTEMQSAVPMTLGGEFSAYAEAIARDRWRVFKSEERLRVVNIGGTAVGTGLGAPRKYIFLVIEKLRQLSGLGLARGENLIDQTANSDCFVEVSGILKAHAANLSKISNDLRLLSLLEEIRLPCAQVGSSIMPGKCNPVLLEAAIQVSMRVMANDSLIAQAVSRSSLQINEFLPVLAFSLLESLQLLININDLLVGYIDSIEAQTDKIRQSFDANPIIITALLPHLGYDKVSSLLKEFLASGEANIRQFLLERLDRVLVERVFSAQNLSSLGHRD